MDRVCQGLNVGLYDERDRGVWFIMSADMMDSLLNEWGNFQNLSQ